LYEGELTPDYWQFPQSPENTTTWIIDQHVNDTYQGPDVEWEGIKELKLDMFGSNLPSKNLELTLSRSY